VKVHEYQMVVLVAVIIYTSESFTKVSIFFVFAT